MTTPLHTIPLFPSAPELTFRPGLTSAVPATPGNLGGVYDVTMTGASVRVTGSAIPAEALVLTVTFAPDPGTRPQQLFIRPLAPLGWSGYSQPSVQATATYVYLAPVDDGEVVWIGPDVAFFGTNHPASTRPGSVVLTVTAPGFRPFSHSWRVPQAVPVELRPTASAVRRELLARIGA